MKKLFFLALLALCMPMSTWADESDHTGGDHSSGQVDGSDDEVYDGEAEGDYGSIVPSDIQLTYKILTPYDATTETNGEVELEGVYAVPEGTVSFSLSVPHEIQVIVVDTQMLTMEVSYYTVIRIGNNAFEKDTRLTNLTIPYTVTQIGNVSATSGSDANSFADCTSLTRVSFTTDSELTRICNGAFSGCTGLTEIDLPSNLTSLGSSVFSGCTGLGSIVFPEGLTTIGASACEGCTNLTTVTMSGSAQLGTSTFANCTSLEAIILVGDEPANVGGGEGDGSFTGDNTEGQTITLYVPTGAAAAYLATNWASDVNTDTDETLVWNFITEPVTVSENAGDGSSYYATYYVDYDDEDGYFLYDATAYTVESVTAENSYEGTINMTTLGEETIIPTGTAILVEASAAGDYYLYKEYEGEQTTATVGTNMLYGTAEEGGVTTAGPNSSVDYYYYKLSRNADAEENSVGFYWDNSEGSSFTCPAYRAYLAVPQDDVAGVKALKFKKQGDDTTGITSVATATKAATDAIYNLQGVRVSDMSQKGIYIVNGKKVIKN